MSNVRDRIQTLIDANPVVLFMKGNRQQPMCGFSAAATNTLNEVLPEYHTVNVLDDDEVRQGIKEYSNWPTIPQLYIGGEFIGGADILTEMFESGELQKIIPQEALA